MSDPVVRMPAAPHENQIEAAIAHLPDMTPERAKRALRSIYSTFVEMRPGSGYPADVTPLMVQLLETIRDYQEDNGFAPTQYELARMFGVDRATIRKRLMSLRKKGYLAIRRGHRGIVLLKTI